MPEREGRITIGHGEGGTLTRALIQETILPCFDNPILKRLEDAAVFEAGGQRKAFTTDAYIVKPLFYPGGDIGRLSVCGTVNDLSVMGARPLALSASLIIEEGLAIETLKKILASMRDAAREAGVSIVAGDTKVVEKGQADGLYVSTAGVGVIEFTTNLSLESVRPGDRVIVSGSVGDHGAAVMVARGEFKLKAEIGSDNAPLVDMILGTLKKTKGIKFMRDPTRGGLAATLNEIAAGSACGIAVREADIPIKEEVRACCDILGLDPLYVASEGRAVIITAAEETHSVLKELRKHPLGKGAAEIGEVNEQRRCEVRLETSVGGERILDMPSGVLLPRIC
jgi:hydrogenase expression/formation protein HypE